MDAVFGFQVLDGHSFLLNALGYGLWPGMVLLSEIVQTTILADFCYYYVKRYVRMLYTDDQADVILPLCVLGRFQFKCKVNVEAHLLDVFVMREVSD